ncbi:MAG: HEPN domain-containing protein [Planctomycetes bacterium]|nr:HEPN domain-containing protein [Planctomycetota bacterium]
MASQDSVPDLEGKSRENRMVSRWSLEQRYYDACASRAYYAALQAARAALERHLRIDTEGMSHANIQAGFNDAVRRKKLPCDTLLHGKLNELMGFRDKADYGPGRVSERIARLAMRTTEEFAALLSSEGNHADA